ncbi:MAG: segregation/condensation protein A [Gemmatimonadota bacterium]
MTSTLVQPGGDRDGILVVDLERFQGPLDLLLHLIRQQDIDIFDIPISRITQQFLKAIQGVAPENLDHAGEFLEMAATLIRIKAQMLLPRYGEEVDDDPRAELVRRLLEYEQIREVVGILSAAEADRARRFIRGYVPPRPRASGRDQPLESTWEEVFAAALEVRLPDPRDPTHRVTTREVAMEDKITLILSTLESVTRVEFRRLLDPLLGTMHGVMTFLATLELGRRRALRMRQASPFAELWIYRRDPSDDPWPDDAWPDAPGPDGPTNHQPDDPGGIQAQSPTEPQETLQ